MEQKYTIDDMKNCFEESRQTHPMFGFKHDTFDDFIFKEFEMYKIQKETTIEKARLTSKRCDGNTTRLIDNAIQILFSRKICIVIDHFNNKESNKHLIHKIKKRITSEHPEIIPYLSIINNELYINPTKL